jgi:hypothetical protein
VKEEVKMNRLFFLDFMPTNYCFQNGLNLQGKVNPTLSFGGQLFQKLSVNDVPLRQATVSFMLLRCMYNEGDLRESKYTYIGKNHVGMEIGSIEFYEGFTSAKTGEISAPHLYLYIGLAGELFQEIFDLAEDMASIKVGFVGNMSTAPKKTDLIDEPFEFLWDGTNLQILSLTYFTRAKFFGAPPK